MKKIFITSLLLLSFMFGVAQNDSKVRLGFELGANFLRWGGDFDDYKPTFNAGGYGGMLVEFLMRNERWSIQPEALFSYERSDFYKYPVTVPKPSQSTKPDQSPPTTRFKKESLEIIYLKAPVIFCYNIELGSSGRLSPGIGPFFSAGITGTLADQDVFKKVIGRFDWGVQGKLTYEYVFENGSGLFGSMGCSRGFLEETQALGLTFSMGYKFAYSKWLNTTYNRYRVR